MKVKLNGVQIDLEKGSKIKVRGSRVEITTRAELLARRRAAMRAAARRRRAAREASHFYDENGNWAASVQTGDFW